MKEIIAYIHGKGGSAEEAGHYRPLFPHGEVVGFDYCAETPWDAAAEFPEYFTALRKRCDRLTVIANSIGAFFIMSAPVGSLIDTAFFISPVVDMEALIGGMMRRANVTEAELAQKGSIPAASGETLSWQYLCYVREHPVSWRVPTRILYGEHDALTSPETVTAFAQKHGAELTVMPGGEHWFHTAEQMRFLDSWLLSAVKDAR